MPPTLIIIAPPDQITTTETDLHRARRALLAARLRTDKTWRWKHHWLRGGYGSRKRGSTEISTKPAP